MYFTLNHCLLFWEYARFDRFVASFKRISVFLSVQFFSLFILEIECPEFDNSDRYVLVWVSEQSGFTEDIETFGNPYRYMYINIYTIIDFIETN